MYRSMPFLVNNLCLHIQSVEKRGVYLAVKNIPVHGFHSLVVFMPVQQ